MKSQVIEPVNIRQAKEIVRQAARIYFARDPLGQYIVDTRRARPVCLMGPAGVGKTEIVRQVAREEGLAFLSYSVTHHTRQSLVGLPRLTTGVVEGKEVAVTEYTMSEIIAQVYRTMEETGLEEGILFLDEYNCASESLRPIMLQLLQEKSFGPHAIPKGWMLVLAGNPVEYNRAATELDPVTADRMRMVHIVPDYSVWKDYMRKRDVNPVVLSYLDNYPENFYSYRYDSEGTALVTARAWEDMSVYLNANTDVIGQEATLGLELIAQYVQSAPIARSFLTYYNQCVTVLASGLAEEVFAGTPAALARMKEMNFQQAWSLVSALMQKLRVMGREAAAEHTLTATLHRDLLSLSPNSEQRGEGPLSERLVSQAEGEENRVARKWLEEQAVAIAPLKAGEDWEAVKAAFETQCRRRTNALQATSQSLSNTIDLCRKALAGTPHLEFLFYAIADSEPLLQVLAEVDCPQFRALVREIGADPEDMARRLEQELEQEEQDLKLGKETA